MHEVHNKTVCKKNSVIDRQPVQLLQSWSYVVTQAEVEKAELLRSEHAAVVQWYVVAGRLVQSYNRKWQWSRYSSRLH